jgi:redox-sensitive bicupin YhaK (pirin superfamily)
MAAPTERVGGEAVVAPGTTVENRTLVLFDRGDEVMVQAGGRGMRFLLVSGKPLEEPVAWHGPIVMNTEEELRQAFQEYRDGTFLKHGRER